MHTEHTAVEAARDYWHVLDVTLSETTVSTSVGLARNLGLELVTPIRTATTRVDYEDEDRRPFSPLDPDLHHRNETVAGAGDPWLMLHAARPGAAWTTAARLGVTVPLGSTGPTPVELGRRGESHQHIQLGTGTFDPLLGLMTGRRLGAWGVTISGLARLALYENGHGYQAGHRYLLGALADRPVSRAWSASLALELQREQPERWDGRLDEEEGNLGRTDLLLTLAVVRGLSGMGGLRLALSVPLVTHARGAQLDYPLIVSVGWSR
ncbi:MAG TPA: hypothetical protein VMT87_00585 [Vicinamibacteria bacterium]|nr:hypothetical protein [Vicinamibacteria bacterium]